MMLGSNRESRRKLIGFQFWFHLIMFVGLVAFGVRGLPLIIYGVYSVLIISVLGLAHTSMLRAEKRAEDQLWWVMCMAGRQGASHMKLESLKELEQAEADYENHRSFENIKQFEHKKNWHDIVLRAYDRAIEDIERVDDAQKSYLG